MRLPTVSILFVALLLGVSYGIDEEAIGTCVQWACAIYAHLVVLCWCIPPHRAGEVNNLLPKSNGYVLLTGCTHGLGLDMSRLFASRGWNLVLVARDAQALAELAEELTSNHTEIEVETIVQDLAVHDASDLVVAQLREKGFTIDGPGDKVVDILVRHTDEVSNAGFACIDMFLSTPLSKLQSMVTLHTSTVMSMTHALLPGMLSRGRGRLVVVSSMIAWLPSPRAAIYAATKAFLASFTHSLAYEVGIEVDEMTRDTTRVDRAAGNAPNIAVVLVTPGPVRTNFAANAACDTSLIFRLPFLAHTSTVVSEKIVRGVIQGKSDIMPGWFNRLTVFLVPKLPSKLSHLICFILWGSGNFERDFHIRTAARTPRPTPEAPQ